VVALGVTVAWAEGAQRFVGGLDELPLAPGLEESPGAVVFDKPGGRIVEADATGAAGDADAVRRFYRSVLPAFGWAAAGDLDFVRGEEALRIEIAERNGTLNVHFSVSPRRDR
jgi:hypothetical protein